MKKLLLGLCMLFLFVGCSSTETTKNNKKEHVVTNIPFCKIESVSDFNKSKEGEEKIKRFVEKLQLKGVIIEKEDTIRNKYFSDFECKYRDKYHSDCSSIQGVNHLRDKIECYNSRDREANNTPKDIFYNIPLSKYKNKDYTNYTEIKNKIYYMVDPEYDNFDLAEKEYRLKILNIYKEALKAAYDKRIDERKREDRLTEKGLLNLKKSIDKSASYYLKEKEKDLNKISKDEATLIKEILHYIHAFHSHALFHTKFFEEVINGMYGTNWH